MQADSGLLFAATGNRGVLSSRDNGASWSQTSLDSQYIWSLHSDAQGSKLLASSPGSGLYLLTEQGARNTKILEEKTHAAAALADFSVIAAATESGLYLSTDAGSSWSQVESLKGQRLSSIQFKQGDTDTLLIGGWKGGVWEYSLSGNKTTMPGNALPVVHLSQTDNAVIAGTWGKGIHVYPDANSSSYLIEATKAQDVSVVTSLLNNGANVDGFDAQRNTALIYASRDGYTSIAKSLIAKGADVNWVDGEQVTPLVLASFKNHPEIVKLLLANGASRDFVDGFGKSATDYAAERGNNDPVLRLLHGN